MDTLDGDALNTSQQQLCFVADSTLGKLATYLRLAGFDTLKDNRPPDGQHLVEMAEGRRIVLTRSRSVLNRLKETPTLFIEHDQPSAQLRQVFGALNVRKAQLRPMRRCSLCNQLLEKASKDLLVSKVPAYVWQHCSEFKTCTRCKKVYWPGTHAQRWMETLMDWLD